MAENDATRAPMHKIGWYAHDEQGGSTYVGPGFSYFNGVEWINNSPPVPQATTKPPLSFPAALMAVFLGGLLVWLAVWGLAQIDPNHFYWPVKFVVKQLP